MFDFVTNMPEWAKIVGGILLGVAVFVGTYGIAWAVDLGIGKICGKK